MRILRLHYGLQLHHPIIDPGRTGLDRTGMGFLGINSRVVRTPETGQKRLHSWEEFGRYCMECTADNFAVHSMKGLGNAFDIRYVLEMEGDGLGGLYRWDARERDFSDIDERNTK